MKSRKFLVFLSIGFLIGIKVFAQGNSEAIQRCSSFERDQLRGQQNPLWIQTRVRLDSLVSTYTRNSGSSRVTALEIIRIPVVVHVVHNQTANTIGGSNNSNISEEQIRSQIEVLNEDFRKKPGTPGFNSNPVGADAYIEFYLADTDPNGAPSSGITRHLYTAKTMFDPYTDDLLLANIVSWPTDKYLNIWTCRLTNSNLAIAQFPSTDAVEGLDTASEPSVLTDGVIVDYRYLGRNSSAITSRIYNLGRTTTHEVGHWLGLIHTWGDSFCGTDYCPDTPTAEGSNQTTVCTPKFSNCNGVRTRNMIENYMDYSPDSCMNIFTNDQVTRMRAVMELSPRRARLVEFSKQGRLAPADNLTVDIYPNPAESDLFIEVRFPDFQDITYKVYDLNGRTFESVSYPQVYSRRLRFDVRVLPPGIYLIKINANNETITRRFVVN